MAYRKINQTLNTLARVDHLTVGVGFDRLSQRQPQVQARLSRFCLISLSDKPSRRIAYVRHQDDQISPSPPPPAYGGIEGAEEERRE